MKLSSIYICQNCGFESPKWQGRCPSCGNWNSFVETVVASKTSGAKNAKIKSKGIKPLKLDQIESLRLVRTNTGINELDRVLGGGIVPGSIVLLAGEPGMGKSTLLTQLALKLSKDNVYYVCGEESPGQVKLRIERLGLKGANLYLLPETNVENIIASLSGDSPRLVIIDSIQTVWTENLSGMAGSVGQIREAANILREYAKSKNVPVFLVGHVTKEGEIAGPKILEHMVDTVLYIEGDKTHEFRILRAVKNRFGPTDEVGIFIMDESGMRQVPNPSNVFLSENLQGAGSCTIVAMEGVRPILVEVQALVVQSQLPVPRRVARGIDYNRLQILCAVLQKKAGISLYNQDVYLSVSGGLRITEPAADFGICLAVASSYKNKKLPEHFVAVGEVGLLGQIKKVQFLDKRVKQARALGYKKIAGPDKFTNLRQSVQNLL